jgi:hypothetical protein
MIDVAARPPEDVAPLAKPDLVLQPAPFWCRTVDITMHVMHYNNQPETMIFRNSVGPIRPVVHDLEASIFGHANF